MSVVPCKGMKHIFCFKRIDIFNVLILPKKVNKTPKILQNVPQKELIFTNYHLFRILVTRRFVTEDVKAKKAN